MDTEGWSPASLFSASVQGGKRKNAFNRQGRKKTATEKISNKRRSNQNDVIEYNSNPIEPSTRKRMDVQMAAATIQSFLQLNSYRRRERRARERVDELLMTLKDVAANKIQQLFRAYCLRKQNLAYRVETSSVILLQRNVRMFTAKSRYMNKKIETKHAALIIQRAVRNFDGKRRHLMSETMEKRNYLASFITVWVKNRLEIKRKRQENHSKEICATKIKLAYRDYLERRRFREREESAKLGIALYVQSRFRGRMERKRVTKYITMYKLMRKWVTKQHRVLQKFFFARLSYYGDIQTKKKEDQASTRITRAMKCHRLNRIMIRESACLTLQSAYRGYHDRLRVKQLRLASKLQENMARRERSVVLLQALIRGYFSRKLVKILKKRLSERFRCSNCGLLEPGGQYCKGCGRRRLSCQLSQQTFVAEYLDQKRSSGPNHDSELYLSEGKERFPTVAPTRAVKPVSKPKGYHNGEAISPLRRRKNSFSQSQSYSTKVSRATYYRAVSISQLEKKEGDRAMTKEQKEQTLKLYLLKNKLKKKPSKRDLEPISKNQVTS